MRPEPALGLCRQNCGHNAGLVNTTESATGHQLGNQPLTCGPCHPRPVASAAWLGQQVSTDPNSATAMGADEGKPLCS